MRINIFIISLCICHLAYSQNNDFNDIRVKGSYVGDAFASFSGGMKTGQTYLGLLNFEIGFNTKDIGLWKNGEFFGQMQNTHGGNPSGDYIGDMQIASNIEYGNYSYLYELWYKHNIANISIQTGLMDLNAYCHVSEVAGFFLNSSFGIMPTASLNMSVPIFPATALGILIGYDATERLRVIGGVWDGYPGDSDCNPYNTEWSINNNEGYLYMLESQYSFKISNTNIGSFKLGTLYHSKGYESVNDTIESPGGCFELHSIVDYNLIYKPEGVKGKTDAFLQIGYNPKNKINQVPFYMGCGFNYTGLFSKSAKDILGLAIANATINRDIFHMENTKHCHEMVIELSYALPVKGNLVIQPDFQYIMNPGIDKGLNNVLCGFLRFYISTN